MFRRRATDRDNQVPGVRKAAILLLGIGEPVSANVIRQLDPNEIRQISNEIARLDAVAPDQMIGVFREFETLSASGRFFARGGPERARRLIETGGWRGRGAETLWQVPPAQPEVKRLHECGTAIHGIDPGELATALA